MKSNGKIEFSNIYSDDKVGQAYWYVIHYFAILYPDRPTISDRSIWHRFYTLLADLLPCNTCQEDYLRFQEDAPIADYLDCSFTLFDWSYRLHNYINKKLDKNFTIELTRCYGLYRLVCFDSDKFVQFLLLLAINYDTFSKRTRVSNTLYLRFIETCLAIIPADDGERLRKKMFPLELDRSKERLIRSVISCFSNYWLWVKKLSKIYLFKEHRYLCDQCVTDCCL
jgi:hypothetical protein